MRGHPHLLLLPLLVAAAAAQQGGIVALRGLGPQLWFGEVEWTWSDFRKVGDALLPFHGELRFDGKAEPQSARQLHAIALDPELPADFFAPRRH